MSIEAKCKLLDDGKRVLTAPFRASFPSLFEPTSMHENQEKKYQLTMLFPKDTDLKALKKIAKNAMNEKFKKGKPKGFKSPFRKGSEKPDLEGYADTTFVKASSKRKPGIVDQRKKDITDPEKIYPGIWLRAVVNAFAYDTAGNKGVSFGLQSVQIVKDDDSFYGDSNPEKDFDEIETEVEDIDEKDLFDDDDNDDEDDDF
jgi:hypothetical protein